MTPADIVDYCLEEIETGRRTLAECVAQFPECAELEAQLRAAQIIRAYPAPTLRPAVNRQIENRLRRLTLARLPRPVGRWQWAIGAVVMLVGVMALVYATTISLPGETLYGFKRLAETAQLSLTPPSARASYYLALTERRLAEIAALTQAQRLQPNQLADLLEDVTHDTQTALALVPQASPGQQATLLNAIVRANEKETTLLLTLQTSLSPEAQNLAQTALAEAEHQTSLAVEQLNALSAEVTEPPASATHRPTLTNTVQPTLAHTSTPTPSSTVAQLNPTDTQIAPNPFTPTFTATAIPPSATHTHTPIPTINSGPEITPTSHIPPSHTPNCHAQDPHSPNYCTPTPTVIVPAGSSPTALPASATPCPTNASGKPKCRP